MSERERGVYIDASGLVKLVIAEPESDALRRYLEDAPRLFASRIAAVEVWRAVARQAERDAREQVASILAGVSLVELDEGVAWAAATIGPPNLRTLDAIDLASALIIADGLRAVVAYDGRLASAARSAGLEVVAPA